jgi:hypothetical protein
VPLVAVAAGAGLVPLAFTGIPVIARVAISTALFGSLLALTRAFPRELRDLAPRRAA